MEEDKKVIAHYFGYSNYKTFAEDEQIKKSMGTLSKSIVNIINELERLQKENNDLRAIKETVRYLEEAGVKDDLYYVVGRGLYLADVLNSAFNDYIPKQVIRNKIEELKAKYNLGDDYWQYDYDVDMNTIDILKELLGE